MTRFLAQLPAATPTATVANSSPPVANPTATVSVPPNTAAASASDPSAYTRKDAASNLLSLVAIGISIWSLSRNSTNSRRSNLLTKLQICARDFNEKSGALLELLERNLKGDITAHALCGTAWKSLQGLASDLERQIPCRSEEIFRAVQTWQDVTMGEPYPVQIAERALQPDSPHFDKLHAAQKTLHDYFHQLEDDCLLEKVKYWERARKVRTKV